METSLTPAEAIVRPWRTATIVAGGIALVEAALVIALLVTLLGKTDGVAAASRTPGAAPSAPKTLPRTKIRVLVLNGNGRTGAAAAEATILRSLRYKVAGVGNADRTDYGRSAVLYTAGRSREGQRLALDLGIKVVGPLDGLSSKKLRGATLAVILGR